MSSRLPDRATPLRRYSRGFFAIAPSLFGGFFTWLSFLILGLRAQRREWIVTATAYAVYASLAFFALSRPEIDTDEATSTLLGGGIFFAWFGGLIHISLAYQSFSRSGAAAATAPAGWPSPARRNRRQRAAAPPPPPPAGDDFGLGLGNPAADYLASSQPPAGMGGVPPTTAAGAARSSTPPSGSASLPPPVEANTARRRALARLPGVTPALARRWVDERNRRGGFRDIDELAVALDLQPHEIVRLRPLLSFAAQGSGPTRRRPGRGRGRVLDV